MKRILAVFLTLAMALNIAPMAAFAAADSDAASIVAVEETDENASPQLDEETAKAIASDPFLQAAYAQTEQEQTGQAEVDTSNMSVSATNSFGQLLVNGIEGQNADADGSTNRITNVTMNGRTANVQYVLDGTADLMVAIYTDSTEEEMVASGTTEVSGSADNGAAQVSIVGDIPETYTIKAFLLDKTDHSPLSGAYTDVSHTQVMVDLDKATVNDFPEDRVINLDGQANTNFAVVNKETTLLTYEDNTAGENQLLSEDDTSLVYTFGNAGAEIRNLQPGDILTYEYAPGELLIARVQDITVNGDVVTIQGDDTLELEDVFDALKIENDANTQDFDYTPADGFTDCGESVIDASLFEGGSDFTFEDVDATNKKSDEIALPEVSRKCEFYKDIDSDEGKKDDHTTTLKATVSGSLNLSAQGKFKYYIAKKRQSLEFGVTTKGDLKLEISGAAELSVPVGRYDFSPIVGVFIGMEPALVVRAALNMNVDVLIEDYIGFRYNSKQDLEETPDNTDTSATEDPRIVSTSKTPTIKIKGKATGSLFVGIDLQPRVRVLGDWVASVEMSCEFGGQITVTVNAESTDHLAESKHTCGICYSGKLDFHASSDISVKFLKSKIKIGPVKLIDVPIPLGDFYWSPKYAEFGKGECPHIGYRVQMRISTTDEISNEDVDGLTVYNLYSNGKTFPLGAYERSLLEGANIAYIYLEPGPYQLQVTVKGVKYTSDKFAISDGPRDFMYLYAVHTGTDPDTPDPDKPDPDNPDPDPTPPSETIVASGTCGDNLTWKLDDEGTLTISGKGAMTEWVNSDSAPWKTYSNTINKVVIQPGVTSIGGHAFSKCKNLTSITIPEGVTSIEDSVFFGCGLRSITIPEGVTSIGAGAFRGCSSLKNITIPESVTSIEENAFYACDGLIDVTYHSTMERWEKIYIESNNNYLLNATIHCTDGDILPTAENSITTGAASASGSKFQATFADAKAGKEYVVLVSRSDSDPLNADNLIYINQITANADGELTVPFITAADAAEMTYVVACAQDDATVDPGQPDQPGEDKPSSGGDGGGAAIILIGGVAAVAAVAGVVLMMPVKVEGTVKLADQPVANASVQVLKNGNVAAQTTTDANGHFTVKVKRGSYTLRVQWTDAEGQPVMRTVDFKAPNANLNVAA